MPEQKNRKYPARKDADNPNHPHIKNEKDMEKHKSKGVIRGE